MTDYFFCADGDCKSCPKNKNSVFGCDKYGVCDHCIAKHTPFCDECKYSKED